MKKTPKTINGLMKHLRNNNNIGIKNSKQKNQLITQGYYHGYKAYRFYKTSYKMLPITNYEEINQTIIYDSNLKALLYDKIMFIETALKNIVLDVIINKLKSDNINTLYEKGTTTFNNSPKFFNNKQRNEAQKNLLSLQISIQRHIFNSYDKKDPKITHFYNNNLYSHVPIWAIFEILTLGDFGHLIKTLTFDLRDEISKRLGIGINIDPERTVLSKYVFLIKDLRNSIAHNGVIYDCRFNRMSPSNGMKKCLCFKTNLNKINFDSFVDYITLICYLLKTLKVNNKDIKQFIKEYKFFTKDYINNVPQTITKITIAKDWEVALNIISNTFFS